MLQSLTARERLGATALWKFPSTFVKSEIGLFKVDAYEDLAVPLGMINQRAAAMVGGWEEGATDQ